MRFLFGMVVGFAAICVAQHISDTFASGLAIGLLTMLAAALLDDRDRRKRSTDDGWAD
jgi:hypothetical protein